MASPVLEHRVELQEKKEETFVKAELFGACGLVVVARSVVAIVIIYWLHSNECSQPLGTGFKFLR